MANPIAIVNGVEVYSDKQVSSVVNTRITFSDGSYVDVATGEVVNRGPGYINLSSQPKSTGEQKSVKKTLKASQLEVSDVISNVTIQPYSGSEIEIVITGPESLASNIEVGLDGDTAFVRGKNTNTGGTTIIQSGGGFSIRGGTVRGSVVIGGRNGISIIGDSVVMDGSVISTGGKPEVSIEIKVPVNTGLSVADIEGDTTIGDVEGNLRVRISGSGSVTAGRMRKFDGRISGSGDINVSSVKGDAKLRITGTGDVSINGGDIEELEVSVSGVGNVRIQAKAQNADLDVSGVGDIYVSQVANRPRRRVSGMGNINVGNW